MKELDVLLERYVRSNLPAASDADRDALRRLLELPDPLLADYLFGHAQVADPSLGALVRAIRDIPGDPPRKVGVGECTS